MFNTIKKLAKRAKDAVFGKAEKSTASIQPPKSRYPKMLYESVPLVPVPEKLQPVLGKFLLGKPAPPMRSPRGTLKRGSDAIAAQLGMNNKQRRRLRSEMRRTHEVRMEDAA